MVRFLHTSDWQLGMTRHYFSDRAQGRYSDSRFEAIVRLGELASEHGAEFIVVAGDVFETNQVDRQTVSNALNALASVRVPVYVLPGNHDPLGAASVYRQPTFERRRPSLVHVLDSSEPVEFRPGVEIVGAPWRGKRPLEDLVQSASGALRPTPDVLRVLVAHGAVDTLSPNSQDPALIDVAAAERALSQGRFHYLALGDRHSLTALGTSGRIFYSGAPEPTDFDEVRPGCALLVELDASGVRTQELTVGRWRFERRSVRLDGDADLDALASDLDAPGDKSRCALKLDLVGTLTLTQKARLDALLELQRDDYGALIDATSQRELVVVPQDSDFSDLGLAGFGAAAVQRLRELAASTNDEAEAARDALALLARLARSDA